MTMTKYDLARYQDILREIRQIKEDIERIESPVKSVQGKAISDMPIGPRRTSDRIGDVVASTEDLKKLLKRKVYELNAERIKIENAIDCLQPIERTICRYRYINGMKWEDICVKIGYSWERVHSYHRRALGKLKDK